MSNNHRTMFECINPILRVEDMKAALRYYIDVLGFTAADWGDDHFTCVSRDNVSIYLAKGQQGHPGTWVWIGVGDSQQLYAELKAKGAKIRRAPTNFPWALEMQVEDVDGNVLRIGSEPKVDQPYESWPS